MSRRERTIWLGSCFSSHFSELFSKAHRVPLRPPVALPYVPSCYKYHGIDHCRTEQWPSCVALASFILKVGPWRITVGGFHRTGSLQLLFGCYLCQCQTIVCQEGPPSGPALQLRVSDEQYVRTSLLRRVSQGRPSSRKEICQCNRISCICEIKHLWRWFLLNPILILKRILRCSCLLTGPAFPLAAQTARASTRNGSMVHSLKPTCIRVLLKIHECMQLLCSCNRFPASEWLVVKSSFSFRSCVVCCCSWRKLGRGGSKSYQSSQQAPKDMGRPSSTPGDQKAWRGIKRHNSNVCVERAGEACGESVRFHPRGCRKDGWLCGSFPISFHPLLCACSPHITLEQHEPQLEAGTSDMAKKWKCKLVPFRNICISFSHIVCLLFLMAASHWHLSGLFNFLKAVLNVYPGGLRVESILKSHNLQVCRCNIVLRQVVVPFLRGSGSV